MSNFNNASLIVTPNAKKAGKLYSIKPTSGVGDLGVVRATTATYVGSDGLIKTALANEPRFDYTNGSCPSILVEPQRTNLLLRSEEFDNTSVWANITAGTGVNPIRIANVAISPDGTQNAETIVFNRGAGNTILDQVVLQQSITIPTTGAYIFSVYAKASTAGDVGKQVFLRLGGSSLLVPITLTGNWVRYSRAETSVASGIQIIQIGNRGTITANNTVSVDLWGAQVEAGSNATSYIPTVASAVTRNADVISKTGLSGITSITETFENGTTNVISGSPTSYTMSQSRIKHVIGL